MFECARRVLTFSDVKGGTESAMRLNVVGLPQHIDVMWT